MRVNLRHNNGTQQDQKVMVWAGDSLGEASSGPPYTVNNEWRRVSDLFARSLCTRGAIRYNYDYFTDPYNAYRGWVRDGSRDGTVNNVTEVDTTSLTVPELRQAHIDLAGTYDLIYHNVAYGGTTAGGTTAGTAYTGTSAYTSGNSYRDDRIDYFVASWITNDWNADSPSTFQTNLTARLDDWNNVGRKYVFLNWVVESTLDYLDDTIDEPSVATSYTGGEYWDATVAAAAAATPGDRQDAVQVVSLLPNMLAGAPDSAGTYSYDKYGHLKDEGARLFNAKHAKGLPLLSPWGRTT